MTQRRKVLVIEDEEDIALSLKYNFEKDGAFLVDVAADGEKGLLEAGRKQYDLVILDLNLPGIDGLSVCKALRKQRLSADVPIIMLTARVDETDKVVGLELGADDYVTKPFSTRELVARARALLRRSGRAEQGSEAYSDGVMFLDPESRVLRVKGKPVSLTRKEFDLLVALVNNRPRVMTREHLLESVWGYRDFGESRTVDVHVRRVRKKLGDSLEGRLETVIGVGYCFREPGGIEDERT
ncbi:MAG TPA: response regulator transcription factor [Patescibacteria group bacterium]|nr:response regulator transcription factor [Patescibacteria group bacterium]